MIGRIEIVAGDGGWQQAEPLLESVWPPDVVATLPWKDVVWANADWRVLVFDPGEALIGHVGIFLRHAAWDTRAVKVGGVGSVATREDCRRQGVARAAMRRAAQEMRDVHGVDFALLFCEQRLGPIYEGFGWRRFAGDVFATQPRGRVRFDVTDPYVLEARLAPVSGVLDLCGLPW